MNCLYLDLASHDGLIAGSDGKAVLAAEPCDHKIGDHELMPLIEKVLTKAEWKFNDLTHIACVSGPGGFTSLRVAVTCANVLADQLRIPSAGIHLSDVYRAKIKDPSFIWLHSTKKEELFARTFGDATWTEPTHLSITDFVRQTPRQLPWAGELIPEHQKMVAAERATPKAEEWMPALVSSASYENKLVTPWYGRGY